MENVAQETEKAISGAIKIDEKEIRDHLDGLVRQSVEDTLNALLNAEADAICHAGRYQRPCSSGAARSVGLFGFANARGTLIRQNQMCAKLRTLPSV